MTLGVCLLWLAATAWSSGEPALAQAGQNAPGTVQKQKGKGQKPATGPPKTIEYPTPKTEEAPASQRFRNLALPIGERLDALIDALKPEERPAFLCVSQKAIDRLGIAAFDWGDRAPDPQFPHPIGIAASFDVDLASRIASLRALSDSAKENALFSPIDLVRDPRWGSAGETFGEDPLLVGSMAAAQVAEYRRAGRLAEIGQMGVAGTLSSPVELASRELDALYLEPARIAIAADPAVGLGIEPLARVSSSEPFDSKFLDGTVRKAWGLTGPLIAWSTSVAPTPSGGEESAKSAPPVVPPQSGHETSQGKGGTGPRGEQTSGGAPPPAPPHSGTNLPNKGAEPNTPPNLPQSGHAPSQPRGTAVEALINGCDLFGGDDCKTLVEAAKADPDVAKAMDRALRRVLETEMRTGIFDPPRPNSPAAHPADELSLLQARAADESIVLLKNEGDLLPLKMGYKTVAVIGPNADNPRAVLGANPDPSAKVVTPLEAIKSALGDETQVLYEKGTGLMGREDLETIPADAFVGGLTGEYYDSSNFAGTPVVKHEDNLDLSWKGNPVEGITAKSFSATWTGAILPKVSGRYGIGFTVDGAARLYLDDQLIIDDWHDGPTRTKTVGVDLSTEGIDAQFYVIRIEYARGAGPGSVRLVWSPPQEAPYRAAIEAAIKSDLVILVLGLDPTLEGPGQDRRDIALPDAQEGLLEQIVALGRPTVLVLLNGGPVSSPFAKEKVPAIVEAWYPGEAGSAALAGVLTGTVNPSGKLPVTIYQTNSQLPSPFEPDAARGYQDSVYRPLFGFGSGLSYSHFAYSGLNAPLLVDGSKTVTVGVTVKNVGRRAGEEVVQVYLSRDNPPLGTPRIALKGFRRVHLTPGESQRLVFVLSPKDFSVVHADRSQLLESGPVRVSVGGNQPMEGEPATVSAVVRVKGTGRF